MAKPIAYAIAGEGRGHTSRNLPIIIHLAQNHHIDVYTSKNTYTAYAQHFKNHTNVTIHHIPGFEFCYQNGKVNLPRTLIANTTHLIRFARIYKNLKDQLLQKQYKLLIVDFEPLLSRVASKIPNLTQIHINHQPILCMQTLPLPKGLPWHFPIWRFIITHYQPKGHLTLINSFYSADDNELQQKELKFIGPVLKTPLLTTKTKDHNFILVYLKESIANLLYPLLCQCKETLFRIYTPNPTNYPSTAHITTKPISIGSDFTNDLINCHGIIGVAGIDLPSEAIHLEKPMLAIYEQGQLEQHINGHQLTHHGIGHCTSSRHLSLATIHDFISAIPTLKTTISHYKSTTFTTGNKQALSLLQTYLK